MRKQSLVDSASRRVLIRELEVATTAPERLKGLLGRKSAGSGIWLEPCNGVHTFFLGFAIDVLMLDKSGAILQIRESVPPFRWVWPVRGGRISLELPAGETARLRIKVGDQLKLK